MDPIISQPQEQAPMDSASASPVLPPRHFLNKKFAITATVLILLGGAAYASIWYWQNQQLAQEAVPTFTPRADATAGWKTYTNTLYGFQVKYPQGSEIKDDLYDASADISKIASEGYWSASFYADYSSPPIPQGNSNPLSPPYTDTKGPDIVVNGITWQTTNQADCVPGECGLNIILNTQHNGIWYEIKLSASNNEVDKIDPVFIPILSTFEFSNSAEISTWKVYSDAKRGIEFRYPEKLSSEFVFAKPWPPVITMTGVPSSCKSTGAVKPGNIKIEGGTDPIFCVVSNNVVNSATTHTDYNHTDYDYIMSRGGHLVDFSFSIAYLDCNKYSGSNKLSCEDEVAHFNVNDLVIKFFSTFKFTQ